MLFAAAPGSAQECATCHEPPHQETAHADLECAVCHTRHEGFPHAAGLPTLDCVSCHSPEADQTARGIHGAQLAMGNSASPTCRACHGAAHEVELPGTTRFRRHTAESCGSCHVEEAEEFAQSVHGVLLESASGRVAPTCNTCHGEHENVRPGHALSGAANIRGIRETCAECHADVELMARFGLPTDRVVSFDASFHGLATRAGSQTVAHCGSCHGTHLVLPPSDPRSTIHPDNLDETCGACHIGASQRFRNTEMHQVEGERQVFAAQVIEQVYLILIPLVIGLMLLHHLGDWVRKVRAHFLAGARKITLPAPQRVLRMYPAERLQHGLLVLSFVTLVWSGFALRFPEAWWAEPLMRWEGTFPARGWVHRIAAVVMVAVSVLHAATLLRSRRLREHWLHLWPKSADVREAWTGFKYNIGLSDAKPHISDHSYIEKAEYWAVVWGALMMTASGILLWANTWVLGHLSKAFLDVAAVFHYYEAVLAGLAVVVWHFYSVIFDPDVYPMNFAWLTGFGPSRNGKNNGEQKKSPEQTEPPA